MAQPTANEQSLQAHHTELRDALAYAEAIVDTIREPLLVLDKNLLIRSANRSFYRTFRTTKENTEGHLLYDLGNGQWNLPRLRVLLEELIPKETTIEGFEVQCDFPDLGPKVMLLNARKLWREGNHTELTLLVIEDITERKLVESQLTESERRQAALVALSDHLRDAKSIRDLTLVAAEIAGCILGASRAGYCEVDSKQEYLIVENDWTNGVSTLTGTHSVESFGAEWAGHLKRGELIAVGDVAIDPMTAADNKRWAAFNVRSLLNVPFVENGHLVALFFIHDSAPRIWTPADLTFVRKVADRTWAAVERAHALIERQRAEDQREQLTNELRRSNEELSQFAHIVAHDLQSPIRGVTSFAQLLQRRAQGRLASGDREFLSQIIDSAHRMQNLVQALLRFAQVGQGRIEKTSVGMDQTVDAAIKSLQVQINEQEAQIERGELPVVQGDAVQLVQLLQNLIGNALKYRRPDDPPHIVIGVAEDRAHHLFSVSDNGEGIAPEHLSTIFEPFKRLHGGDVPGTGLGLATCQKIVARHGGRIWVDSQPGVGSTFYFTLPAV